MFSKNSLIPLNRAVNAAIIDMYEDIGLSKQIYTHWCCREFKLLDRQILKSRKKDGVLLHVNSNTRTATLPPDFEEELFVGVINNQGLKVPLKLNNSIVNTKYIDEIDCVDKCPKCNANKAICTDLEITETSTVVTINSVNYEQTTVKRLQPNGDYFLETNTPYLDLETNVVSFLAGKEFVAHIDLKPCGCVEETVENLETIRVCNPDVYCNYFMGCDTSCHVNYGGYKIFEETGLIQFDYNFNFSQVYLEYNGFLPKINGQYYLPSVAFEAVVEGTKFRAVKNRKNISRFDAREFERYYVNAKNDMIRVMGRTSLARILNSILTTPKFDITIDTYLPYCSESSTIVTSNSQVADTTSTSIITPVNPSVVSTSYVPFTYGTIVSGATVDGISTHQSNTLKGALNLTVIFLNDTTYTLSKGDYTFDSLTGIITLLNGNKFYDSDIIVGQYFKII